MHMNKEDGSLSLIVGTCIYIMTRKNIVDLDKADAKAGETANCKNLPGGIESRCIKMLPDVGMVTYPECL